MMNRSAAIARMRERKLAGERAMKLTRERMASSLRAQRMADAACEAVALDTNGRVSSSTTTVARPVVVAVRDTRPTDVPVDEDLPKLLGRRSFDDQGIEWFEVEGYREALKAGRFAYFTVFENPYVRASRFYGYLSVSNLVASISKRDQTSATVPGVAVVTTRPSLPVGLVPFEYLKLFTGTRPTGDIDIPEFVQLLALRLVAYEIVLDRPRSQWDRYLPLDPRKFVDYNPDCAPSSRPIDERIEYMKQIDQRSFLFTLGQLDYAFPRNLDGSDRESPWVQGEQKLCEHRLKLVSPDTWLRRRIESKKSEWRPATLPEECTSEWAEWFRTVPIYSAPFEKAIENGIDLKRCYLRDGTVYAPATIIRTGKAPKVNPEFLIALSANHCAMSPPIATGRWKKDPEIRRVTRALVGCLNGEGIWDRAQEAAKSIAITWSPPCISGIRTGVRQSPPRPVQHFERLLFLSYYTRNGATPDKALADLKSSQLASWRAKGRTKIDIEKDWMQVEYQAKHINRTRKPIMHSCEHTRKENCCPFTYQHECVTAVVRDIEDLVGAQKVPIPPRPVQTIGANAYNGSWEYSFRGPVDFPRAVTQRMTERSVDPSIAIPPRSSHFGVRSLFKSVAA